MDRRPPRLFWWIAIPLIVVVSFPIWALPAAAVQYAVFPGCYGGEQVFQTGEHLGFRIGMTREESAVVVKRQNALRPAARFAVIDPDAEGGTPQRIAFPDAGGVAAPEA
jgi:hypothetical protein